MSQQNVDLVRQIFAAWEGQDFAAVVRGLPGTFEELSDELRTWVEETYDPDVEVSWLSENPEWQIHRGYAGLLRAYADWMEDWDEHHFELKEIMELGDEVLARHSERARSRHDVEVEKEFTSVFTFRRGRIVRIREYATKEKALEAAMQDYQ